MTSLNDADIDVDIDFKWNGSMYFTNAVFKIFDGMNARYEIDKTSLLLLPLSITINILLKISFFIICRILDSSIFHPFLRVVESVYNFSWICISDLHKWILVMKIIYNNLHKLSGDFVALNAANLWHAKYNIKHVNIHIGTISCRYNFLCGGGKATLYMAAVKPRNRKWAI